MTESKIDTKDELGKVMISGPRDERYPDGVAPSLTPLANRI